LLFALMALLVAAFIAIMGAATREAAVAPGEAVPTRNKRRARIAMGVATAIVLLVLFAGNAWWDSEAVAKARNMIYEAPSLEVSLRDNGKAISVGGAPQEVTTMRVLRLEMMKSLWHSRRPETVMTALVPDHGYLMHLFLLREPGLDIFYHLHPKLVETATDKRDQVSNTFEVALPDVPPGRYQIYADVVRESGFPDTMTAELEIPETSGEHSVGDDSSVELSPEPVAGNIKLAPAVDGPDGPVFALADEHKMVWVRGTAPLVANQFVWLRFRLEDLQGKPVTDVEPYMGMAGHAEIVSFDRSVFAHIHPDGSAAMAAVEMANPPMTGGGVTARGGDAMAAMPGMAGMSTDVMTGGPSATVSFPYGFPKAGKYRIFAQMKRGGVIETGVFDADVVAATNSK
jgi:hypothetical protein